MADLIKIIGVALITVVAFIIVKQTRPEIAMIITIAGSILIILLSINTLTNVIGQFNKIFQATGVNASILLPILKIIAIGYIVEFGANICLDAGATSIADKILFAGKLIILLIALPIINSVIDMVVGLL